MQIWEELVGGARMVGVEGEWGGCEDVWSEGSRARPWGRGSV